MNDNAPQVDNQRSYSVHEQRRLKKRRQQYLHGLFSDMGLALVIIMYILFGAFLFQYIEYDAVIQKCEEGKGYETSRNKMYAVQLLNYIQFNLTDHERVSIINRTMIQIKQRNNLTIDPVHIRNASEINSTQFLVNQTLLNINLNDTIDVWLVKLSKAIHNISDSYKYVGKPCHQNSWIFESSILFSITLITTIGYGHITPITWDGQVISMCFSIIGIPLFLLWISRISHLFGRIFRSLYTRVVFILRYLFCEKLCCRKVKLKKENRRFDVDDIEIEEQSSMDSIDDLFFNQSSKFAILSAPVKKTTIPVVLVLIIIGLYFYIGSLVLYQLEGWNLTQSIYFAFISMSTIGFGDFVPGIQNFKNRGEGTTQSGRILLGVSYLIFGIIVMAMCYDLIEEDLFIKWTKLKIWLHHRTGINLGVDDEGDEESSEAAKTKMLQYIGIVDIIDQIKKDS